MIQELAVIQQIASQAASPPELWAVVLPALVAAVFGTIAGWAGAYLKVKAENYATKADFEATRKQLAQTTRTIGEENARITRRAELDSELREAVRLFAVAAGGMIHGMCWLTWDYKARNRVNDKMVTAYDKEAHELLPTIVAQLAVIAMLDRDVHGKLSPFADEIITLDADMSAAIIVEEQDPGSHSKALTKYHVAGSELETRFRHGVANLFPQETSESPQVDSRQRE